MKSKYYRNWPEYLDEHPEMPPEEVEVAVPKLQMYEEQMLSFILFLCF